MTAFRGPGSVLSDPISSRAFMAALGLPLDGRSGEKSVSKRLARTILGEAVEDGDGAKSPSYGRAVEGINRAHLKRSPTFVTPDGDNTIQWTFPSWHVPTTWRIERRTSATGAWTLLEASHGAQAYQDPRPPTNAQYRVTGVTASGDTDSAIGQRGTYRETGRITNKINQLIDNQSHVFEAAGTSGIVTWRVVRGGGFIASTGRYSPPRVSANTVVEVGLLVDGQEVDTDTFTVLPRVEPGIANKIEQLAETDTWTFTAQGFGDAHITWQVLAGGGTIAANGTYSPQGVDSGGALVTVGLFADGLQIDTNTFRVLDVVAGSWRGAIANKIESLKENETHRFIETGVGGGAVGWAVNAGGGVIAADGAYAPPNVSSSTLVTIALEVGGVQVDTNTFRVEVVAGPGGRMTNKLSTLFFPRTWHYNTSGVNGALSFRVRSGGGAVNDLGLYIPPVTRSDNFQVIVDMYVDGVRVDSDTFRVRRTSYPQLPNASRTGSITNKITELPQNASYSFAGTSPSVVRRRYRVIDGGGSDGSGTMVGSTYTPFQVPVGTTVTVELIGHTLSLAGSDAAASSLDRCTFIITAAENAIESELFLLFAHDTRDFNHSRIVGGAAAWQVLRGGGSINSIGFYQPPNVSGITQAEVALLVAGVRVDSHAFWINPGLTLVANPSWASGFTIDNEITELRAGESHTFVGSVPAQDGTYAYGGRLWRVSAGGGNIDILSGVYDSTQVPVGTVVTVQRIGRRQRLHDLTQSNLVRYAVVASTTFTVVA